MRNLLTRMEYASGHIVAGEVLAGDMFQEIVGELNAINGPQGMATDPISVNPRGQIEFDDSAKPLGLRQMIEDAPLVFYLTPSERVVGADDLLVSRAVNYARREGGVEPGHTVLYSVREVDSAVVNGAMDQLTQAGYGCKKVHCVPKPESSD